MKFSFIKEHAADFGVTWMCRRLGVSPSGYYAYRGRPATKRALRDARLSLRIQAIHRQSRGTYGRPRICDELRAQGHRVGPRRVGRLMRAQGLFGRMPKRFKKTTDSKHDHGYAPNLLQQNFSAPEPNRVWLSDITYVRTWQGWLYVAVTVDAFSRRVVGYAIDDHMRTDLVLDALRQAVRHRRPGRGLVHHSDRGTQYASEAFRKALRAIGAKSSMSSTGNCFDNAAAESFFSTLKQELIHRHAWPTKASAKAAIADYIDHFYNPRRRHSFVGNISPLDFELQFMRQAA